MRRREFITLLGGSAAAWPLAARAQQPKIPVIGFLSSFNEAQSVRPLAEFRRGLQENGLAEGRNAVIESRYADGRYNNLPGLAAELASRPVDLIFASGPPAALAAKAATTAVPVVFVVGFDPVTAGLVGKLNRPGGNVTGMTLMNSVLAPKRVEILLDLVPKATAIAIIVNQESPDTIPEIDEVTAAMKQRGVGLQILNARTFAEFDGAIDQLRAQPADALVVGGDPLYLSRPAEIVPSVTRLSIPAIYGFREFTAAGGLISYGANRPVSYRQAGAYASRILKGEKPADLPVMQPTTFELTINLKTAKTLGVTVPDKLLATADEVIE
jgi:putative tryptophan/tyrosine transport system substrate-binding protein